MSSIIMGLILVAGPILGYFLGDQSNQGVLIGLGLASLVVVAYLVIDRIPLDALVFGVLGGAAGLFLAKVADWLVFKFDNPALFTFMQNYSILVYIFFGLLGMMIAVRKLREIELLEKNVVVRGGPAQDVKILDTSVLIDGRLADVIETGFLDGRFVVPRFVLAELQAVADSSDATKRQRGRRGLDILKQLQDQSRIALKIYDKDYMDLKEVDHKLVRLAKELNGKIATTDFNLNKVAALQGVTVLNMNDLAGALKMVVLPGDTLGLFLIKDGKEKFQAVGYLDDGTMVVVDDARKAIGRRVDVHVNSILQTSAGRMIFGRLADSRDGGSANKETPPPQPDPQPAAG